MKNTLMLKKKNRHTLLALAAATALAAVSSLQAAPVTWQGGSNWNSGGNWSSGSVPSGTDVIVQFNGSGSSSVNLNSSPTLGGMLFNQNSFSITNTNTITLNVSTGNAFMNVNIAGSSISIAPSLSLADSLDANVVTGSILNITGNIGESVSGKGINVNSGGTLALSGTNSYTGATTVNNGVLALTGGSMSASAVNVTSTGRLLVAGNYTIGSGTNSSLTVASGGTLDMATGVANTLTLSNTTTTGSVLNIGNGGASVLNMDLGATADRITVSNGRINIGTGYATINLNLVGALSGTTQTLISAAGGVNGQSFANLAANASLVTTGNYGGVTVGLSSTTTSLVLTESVNATPTNAYWTGGVDANWNTFTGGNANTTNWATDATGATNTKQDPGSTTNVFFAANTASNLTNTLAQNYSINSLTFTGTGTAAANSVTINGNTLAIGTGGITVNAGSGAHAINSALVLSGAQAWQNNSTGLLTMGGNVANGSNLLTINGTGAITVNGIIGAGSGGITKSNTGTLTLNGVNTYTGTTTVSAGLLVTGSAAALGSVSGPIQLNGGTLDLASATSTNAYNTAVGGPATIASDRAAAGAGITHTLGTLAIGAQTLNVTAGGNVSSGTAGLNFGTTTLSASGAVFDTATGTNLTLGALSGNFSFTKQDAGQMTLNTASSRSGGVATVSGGTLKLGSTSALGTTAAGVTLSGGTLDLATDTTVNAYPITVNANSTILSDKLTAASAGITHTLGTLAIGGQTLTIDNGANVASGTATVAFGATTLSGGATMNANAGAALTMTTVAGATQNLSITGAGNTTISGGISISTGSLYKTGTGTLTLGGNSTFTGGVNVLGGVVSVGTATAGGNLGNGSSQVVLGDASNTGTLTYTGGTATYTRGFNIGAGGGELDVTNAAGSLTLSSGGIATNGVLTLGGSGTLSNGSTNVISGNGSLAKTGTGVLFISSGNTYAGGTTLKSGTLKIGNSLALGSGTFSIGDTTGSTAVTIDASASGVAVANAQIWNQDFTFAGSNSLTFQTGAVTLNGSTQVTVSANALAVNNAIGESIAGSGITKAGSGILILGGVNTFTGQTVLSGGSLFITNAQALGGTGASLSQAVGTTLTLQNDAGISGSYATTLTGSGTATMVADRASSGATVTHTLGNLNIGSQTLGLTRGANVTGIAGLTFGSATLSGAPVFDTAANTVLTIGALSGNVAFTKQDTGQMVLTTASARTTGTVSVNGGTLLLQDQAALGTAAVPISINGGTLNLATDASVNPYNVTLNGTSTIAAGRETSGATASQTLGTLVTNGNQLNVTVGPNTTGTANLTFGTTTLTAGTTFDVAANANLTLGALSGSVTFDKQNSGTLTLNTASARTSGAFTLNSGAVKLGSTSALGTTGVGITLNGGSLDLATDTSVNAYQITLGGNTTILSDRATAGAGITHTLGTVAMGNQSLTLDSGANVTSGTAGLNLGAVTLSTSGGTISADTGVSSTIASITTSFGSRTLTLGGAGNINVSGAISTSGGALWKTGPGTLTLSGADSYSGGTTIFGGTLVVNNNSALGSSGTIANSGTLQINSGINLSRAVTFNAGSTLTGSGTFTPGSTAIVPNLSPGIGGIGTLTVANGLTVTGTSTLEINAPGASEAAPGASDLTAVTGNLNLSGSSINLVNLGSAGVGAYRLFTFTGTFTGLPTLSGATLNTASTRSSVVDRGAGTTAGKGIFFDVYNLASAAPTQAVTLNGHVGVGKTTGVSLTNASPVNATFTETLASNGFSGTSAGFAASGSASGIAGGASGSGTLQVGFGTTLAAGHQTGTTTVALTSNAVNNSGLAQTSAGSQTIAISGDLYNLAGATASQTVTLGASHVGVGMSTGIFITNNAPVDPTYTETLSTNGFAGTTAGFTASGSASGIAAGDTAGGTLQVGLGTSLTAGHKTGSATLALNSNEVNNSGLGTTAIAPQTVNIVGDLYNYAAAATTQTVNVGNMHVGDGKTATFSVTNTAAVNGTYTETLATNGFSGTSTGFTASGSASGIAGGDSGAGDLQVSIANTFGPGHVSGTTTLALTSNEVNGSGLGTTAINNQTITISGDVYRLATAADVAPTTVNLGGVHIGGTFAGGALTFQNTAVADGYSEGLSANFGSATGAGSGSGTLNQLAAGASNTTSMGVNLGGAQSTTGTVSGTINVNLLSDGQGTSGLGTTALGSQNIAITGFVYTGQGIWNTDGSGAWSNAQQWTESGGTPGVDGALSASDTATFGDALTGGSATITLNGVSPRLAGLTFSGNGSYTIARSGSETLTLDNGGYAVPVSVSGTHTIAVPVILHDDAAIITGNSTDTLTMSGQISGTHGIFKTGSGVLNLTAANTYTGNTTVTGGTLNLTGSIAGNVIIDHATLTGTGTIYGNTDLLSGSLLNPNGIGTTGTIHLTTLTLEDGSKVQIDLGNINSYDQIQLASLALADGATQTTLEVVDLLGNQGQPLHVNDTFQIFSTGIGSAFTTIDLPTGYTWDTSKLATEGKITVLTASVPEPGPFMLGLLALAPAAALKLRKKRKLATVAA